MMRVKIILALSILIIGSSIWYQIPYIKSYYISTYDFKSSDKYKELDSLLSQWCDQYYFVKPTLLIRFNPTNEAYYSNNQITLLVTPDTFLYNSNFLEVALAHEFGHHYSYIKMENLDEKMEEMFADVVALKLVGLDKMKKVLEKEDREKGLSKNYLSNKERIIFLKKINLDSFYL